MPIAIIITLILAGGTGIAAENSLPTDALYPVKINLNESITTALTFGAEAKAKRDVKLAERRLAEAEELTAKNQLNAEARAVIEENFSEHAERVKERIAELTARSDSEAAADLASRFQSSLEAHAAILQKLGEEKQDAEAESVESRIRAALSIVSQNRAEAESRVAASTTPAVKSAAEGKRTAAENKIAEVKSYLDTHGAQFTAASRASAEAELSNAQVRLNSGNQKLAANLYGAAFVEFQAALRIAEEAKLLLEAAAAHDVSVESMLNARGEEGTRASGSVSARSGADAENGDESAGTRATSTHSLRVQVGL